MSNEFLASVYDFVDPVKAKRLRDCSPDTRFYRNKEGTLHIDKPHLCRVRLCPICSFRHAEKVFRQNFRILSAIQQSKPLSYIALTFSVGKNVPAEELAQVLDAMAAAWNCLCRNGDFKDAVKGWYRGVEIAFNKNLESEDCGTYYPCFRVLLAVSKSYSRGRNYISQAKWQALWKQACCLDYQPLVVLNHVKNDTAPSICLELKCRAVKLEDTVHYEDWPLTAGILRLLDKALDKRRFVAFGGVFQDWHKKLNLEDCKDDNLDLAIDDSCFSYFWFTGCR